MSESGTPAAIRLESISKSFGKVRANDAISLDIHAGKILALLGENGAGKSTLMGILAGQLKPDAGRIRINGRPAAFTGTKGALDAGIGMVYQHFKLVEAMTVAENVLLGQKGRFWRTPDTMQARVADLARTYGLEIDPGARISDLSMGEKQRVEILKLLQRQSRFLIFDEPTAVLTPREIAQLFTALKQMARQDKAVVFISHKLDEVLEISDHIVILHRGRAVDAVCTRKVRSKADLARRMVGREVLLDVQKEPMEARQTVLKVRHLTDERLDDLSFDLRQGEIFGLVGVAGNGQKPLVETVCGLKAPRQGSVRILGRPWQRFFAHHRWDRALAYVPEDRQGLATCPNLDLVDNFLLTTRAGFSRGPWLNKPAARRKTDSLVSAFKIQPPGVGNLARRLSGGNLQKLVLAREFFRRPRLIVAEQPTQGLDIAATEEVWRLLLKARERAGILLITGDLNEALALSDRIGVMFNGRLMDSFPATDTDKIAQIGLLMAGIAEPAGV